MKKTERLGVAGSTANSADLFLWENFSVAWRNRVSVLGSDTGRPSFILLCLLLLGGTCVHAQQATVKVSDRQTGEPLPFVHVWLKGTTNGGITDTNGVFSLPGVFRATDSLRISSVGYATFTVSAFSKDTVRVGLESLSRDMNTVEIVAGENPAIILLRKVLERKPTYNPRFRDYFRYDSYSKIEINFLKVSKTPPKKGLLKEFGFMWNNIDTTDSNRTLLPVFFSETAADYYYRRDPFKEKEIVKGTRVSGFENPDVSRMVSDINNKVDLYNEYLYIFNKNFPSPLNDNFKMHYFYYLDDSFSVDGVLHYLVNFTPRNTADPGFTGHLIINGNDYAVSETHMIYRAAGNVNYIRGFDIDLYYTRYPEGIWFQYKQVLKADLAPVEKMEGIPGVYVIKTGLYSNPAFTEPPDLKVFRGEDKLVMNEEALEQKESFWQEKRPEALTSKESMIYRSVDTLRRNTKFRILKGLFTAVGSGYIRTGKIDVGNVQTFFSWNPVEGYRAKLGFRTNRFLSKKFTSEFWVAYGFKDHRVKGGTEIAYYPLGIFKRRHNIGVRAVYDMEQIGMSQNALPLDNLFTSISRTSKLNRLTLTQEGVIHYEHDWFDGFITRIAAVYRRVMPKGDFRFEELEPGGLTHNLREITNTELVFNLRFAYNDRRFSPDFKRRVFLNKYPVLSAEVAHGFKGIFGSDYNYWRMKVRVSHRQKMGKLGYMDYMVEGGKIWGNLPYHLLEVHTGNQSFVNDDVAFNTMRYFEFVSDAYLAIHMENHFEGFFLNRIPLIKKLKWREFIVNKVLLGHLSQKNRQGPLQYPDGLSGLKQPYWETGFGIENIFKVFRIDFLWRIGPIDNPDVKHRFFVKPSLYLRF